MFITPTILPIVFLFGIAVGSFLNTCIYRLPLGEDIVRTNSHCMHCGYNLKWYDLIPLLSRQLLRGRCRRCGEKISLQYPLVELLNGLIWVGLIETGGFTVTAICCCAAASALIVLSIIDFRTFEIPVSCCLIILMAGIANLFFHRAEWLTYAIGFICVSGLLSLIYLVSRGRAMGGGDVKLMAAAGLLLGWQRIILAFAAACILGSVIHICFMKLRGKGRVLAFGPYLSMGLWFSMMWGTELIEWYKHLLMP